MLPDPLVQIPTDEQVCTVTGHGAVVDRGGTAVIPLRKGGRLRRENDLAVHARTDLPQGEQTVWASQPDA